MFSGGIGSWAAAKRVAEQHGVENLTLLFTDTRMEDEDLYRFIEEAAVNVGAPLVKVVEGRTPWQVFFDVKFLGNSRVDPCSRILKRQMAEAWLEEHCNPRSTIIYVGIDWSEEHRFTRLRDRWATKGWTYEAPLTEAPYLSKTKMLKALLDQGIKLPRLYDMGFAHNNCGGFCIKAGHGHFAVLLKAMPERYAFHETKERELRETLGKNISILSDRAGGGGKKPLTLKVFRERIEAGQQPDKFDIGGCGCFVDDPEEEK
jgi:hypothetical protein